MSQWHWWHWWHCSEVPCAWCAWVSHPWQALGCSKAAFAQAGFSKGETAWSCGSDTHINSFFLFLPRVQKAKNCSEAAEICRAAPVKGEWRPFLMRNCHRSSQGWLLGLCVSLSLHTPLPKLCLLWGLPLPIPLSCSHTRQLGPTVAPQSLAHRSQSSATHPNLHPLSTRTAPKLLFAAGKNSSWIKMSFSREFLLLLW